jgi:hypothetical protein
MSIPLALGLGVIAGIVLFFVLQLTGVLDAALERLENLGAANRNRR